MCALSVLTVGDLTNVQKEFLGSAVGNYGEIFNRHLGPNTPLRMERGLNRLWTNGGLLYSPPFR